MRRNDLAHGFDVKVVEQASPIGIDGAVTQNAWKTADVWSSLLVAWCDPVVLCIGSVPAGEDDGLGCCFSGWESLEFAAVVVDDDGWAVGSPWKCYQSLVGVI